MAVAPNEDVLRQADADAGEREADAEPHAAPGADVPNDLGPESRAPADAAAEAEADAPEGAGRGVHGVPALVPPEHALDDHPRLHRNLNKRRNSQVSNLRKIRFFRTKRRRKEEKKWWAAVKYQVELGLGICCR